MRGGSLTTLLFLALTAAAPSVRAEDPVVARAGESVVTLAQFRSALIQNRSSGDLGRLADSMTGEGKRRLLEDLLDLRLLAAQARREGADDHPEVKALVELAADTALVREYLKVVAERVDTSEPALRRFHAENRDMFRGERRVKAAHVVAATREEAVAARKEILSGTPIGEVAKRVNVDSTKGLAGELGWVKRGLFVKNFEEALFALRPGEVSEVVKTSFGHHVIRVESVDPGEVTPFEAIREEVRKAMAADALSRLREELRRKHPATVEMKQLEGL